MNRKLPNKQYKSLSPTAETVIEKDEKQKLLDQNKFRKLNKGSAQLPKNKSLAKLKAKINKSTIVRKLNLRSIKFAEKFICATNEVSCKVSCRYNNEASNVKSCESKCTESNCAVWVEHPDLVLLRMDNDTLMNTKVTQPLILANYKSVILANKKFILTYYEIEEKYWETYYLSEKLKTEMVAGTKMAQNKLKADIADKTNLMHGLQAKSDRMIKLTLNFCGYNVEECNKMCVSLNPDLTEHKKLDVSRCRLGICHDYVCRLA